MDRKILIFILVGAFFASSVLAGTMAFAAPDKEKSLETECAAKKGTIESFLCEAVFTLQDKVAVLTEVIQVTADGTVLINSDKDIILNAGDTGEIKLIGDTSIESIFTFGPTTIDSATGNVVAGGTVTAGPTSIDSATGNVVAGGTVTAGPTSIDSATGNVVAGGTVTAGPTSIDSATGNVVVGGTVTADNYIHTKNSQSSNSIALGGAGNDASGTFSTVGGGQSNTASGNEATIGGGTQNIANKEKSTVSGGHTNTAGGIKSTVGGGSFNAASGTGSTIGGGLSNIVSGQHSTIAGGVSNIADKDTATIAGGASNAASGSEATVGGGSNNIANKEKSTISGGHANTASGIKSTVGGGIFNTAGGLTSTVGGGFTNDASGESSTVSGGAGNTASGHNSTVAGGNTNTASGHYSSVGGGLGNTANGFSSVTGGGIDNTASDFFSTVGGGFGNTASGRWSTVGGGLSNVASGDYSYAMGRQAKALHHGSTVFTDSVGGGFFESTTTNQFSIRAAGGVRIVGDLDVSGIITDGASGDGPDVIYVPKRGTITVGPFDIGQLIKRITLVNNYPERGIITVDGFNGDASFTVNDPIFGIPIYSPPVCGFERLCVDGTCSNVVDTYGGIEVTGSVGEGGSIGLGVSAPPAIGCSANNFFFQTGLDFAKGNEFTWATSDLLGQFGGRFVISYVYNEEVNADTLIPTGNNDEPVTVYRSTIYAGEFFKFNLLEGAIDETTAVNGYQCFGKNLEENPSPYCTNPVKNLVKEHK